MSVSRRTFLKAGIGAGLAASQLDRSGFASPGKREPAESIPRRELGGTGEMLSVIGFGGMVVKDATDSEAVERVTSAMDRGVNYFDVAPIYGNAQEKLGIALKGRRDQVFLACKTNKRTKDEAAAQLEESLRLLKTDHVDLYQLHSMTTNEDVEAAFGPDGAIEAFVEAKKKGQVRFIGFSAHSDQAAMACMDRFEFASILYPLNSALWESGFSPRVIERARKKGMGCLGLKAMALDPIPRYGKKKFKKCWYNPISDPQTITLAFRFALSKGLTAAIPSGDENLFAMALDSKDLTKPLSEDEAVELKKVYEGLTPLFSPRG